MLFNMCTTLNVFLDVDELDNLDNLSFAVKHTRKLLVMLTSGSERLRSELRAGF